MYEGKISFDGIHDDVNSAYGCSRLSFDEAISDLLLAEWVDFVGAATTTYAQ